VLNIARLTLIVGMILLLLVVTGSVVSSSMEAHGADRDVGETRGDPPDIQDIGGPVPPADVYAASVLASAASVTFTIPGVPAYSWRHGCGPTAGGMVMGYWDNQGFDLIPGDASTQTDAVDQAIASDGPASHYTDYSLPQDTPGDIRADKSELPAGDEHPNNCIADYMHTSWSIEENAYGFTWFNDLGPGMVAYASQALGVSSKFVFSTRLYMRQGGTLNLDSFWDSFRAEIDAGRPLVFLVDTNGNGSVNHYVPAVGYGVIDDTPHYAYLNRDGIHWFEFAPVESGQPWGVYGGITFQIVLPDYNYHVFCPLVARER
jgi:hypothetical protein